jgi:hypothetical protein
VTAEEFEAVIGWKPRDDDLERANCKLVGRVGHTFCGMCETHKKPRFLCAHCMTATKDNPSR